MEGDIFPREYGGIGGIIGDGGGVASQPDDDVRPRLLTPWQIDGEGMNSMPFYDGRKMKKKKNKKKEKQKRYLHLLHYQYQTNGDYHQEDDNNVGCDLNNLHHQDYDGMIMMPSSSALSTTHHNSTQSNNHKSPSKLKIIGDNVVAIPITSSDKGKNGNRSPSRNQRNYHQERDIMTSDYHNDGSILHHQHQHRQSYDPNSFEQIWGESSVKRTAGRDRDKKFTTTSVGDDDIRTHSNDDGEIISAKTIDDNVGSSKDEQCNQYDIKNDKNRNSLFCRNSPYHQTADATSAASVDTSSGFTFSFTYESHQFREHVFWQSYCQIEKMKNFIHTSIPTATSTSSMKEKVNSIIHHQKSNATSVFSMAAVYASLYNILFGANDNDDIEDIIPGNSSRNNDKRTRNSSGRSNSRIFGSSLQLRLLKWKQRLVANHESYNISHEDAYAYWEFRMSHSYIPALLILSLDIIAFFIIMPVFHNLFFSTLTSTSSSSSSDSTTFDNDRDIYKLYPFPNGIMTLFDNNIVHFALLAKNFIWLLIIIILVIYFLLYAFFPLSTLEQYLPINMYEMWQWLTNWVLFSRFCLLFFHIFYLWIYSDGQQESMCIDSIDQLPELLPLELPMIGMLNDYCQILVFSLLPVSRIFMFRLWIIEFTQAVLRLTTCLGGSINKLHHVPLSFVIFTVAGGYINAGFISIATVERYLIALFRNMQDQKNASTEKTKLVNMLCNDIKIPTQQLVRTYRSFKSVLYKPKSINMDKHIKHMQQNVSLLNEVIDDLLFLVKVEENRFTFEAKDSIEVADIAILAMNHIGRIFKIPEVICDNMKVEFISPATIAPRSKIPNIKDVLTNKQCLKTILYYSYLALFCMMTNNNPAKLEEVVNALIKENRGTSSSFGSEMVEMLSVMISYDSCSTLVSIDDETIHLLKFQVVLNKNYLERGRGATTTTPSSSSSPISLFDSSCLVCTKLVAACPGNQNWTISNEGIVQFTCMFQEIEHQEEDFSEGDTGSGGSNSDNEIESPLKTLDHQQKSSCTIAEALEGGLSSSIDDEDNFMPKGIDLSKKLGESKDNYSESSDGTIHSLNNIKAKRWLKSFIAQKVLAYVTNKSFESIFVDIVQRFPSGKHITIVNNEPNTAMLAAFQVVVVQSVSVCERLRALQFRGLIVLVSERLTYLDASEQANFDFGLPIPCDKHDLHMFKLWLLKLRRRLLQQTNNHQVLEHSQNVNQTLNPSRFVILKKLVEQIDFVNLSVSIRQPKQFKAINYSYLLQKLKRSAKVHLAAAEDLSNSLVRYHLHQKIDPTKRIKPSSTQSHQEQRKYTSQRWTSRWYLNLMCRIFLLGQLPVQKHSMNNFFRWRYLNPGKSHLHHSVPIDIALTSSIFYMLLGYATGGYQLPMFLLGFLFFGSIYMMVWIIKYIAGKITPETEKQMKYGLQFWKFWYPLVFMEVLLVVFFTTTVFWSPWHNSSPTPSSTFSYIQGTSESKDSFNEFLNKQYGFLYGHEMLWNIIATQYSMRVLTEYLAWPWSLIVGCGKFATTSVFLFRFVRPFLSPSMFFYIYYCFCFICFVIWCAQYWREVVTRRGFRSLYEVIMTKDFRDRLAFLTQVSIAPILEDIHSLQQNVMGGVNQGCLEKEVLITDRLFQHIQAMHVHGMISKEMLTHLQVSDTRFFSLPRQVFVTNMKAMLVKDVLTKICSRFVAIDCSGSFSASFTINELATTTIYVNVAQSLTLVRVDEEVFTAIVVQALATTLKHIQQRILEDRVRNNNATRDDANEIVIWLHPWLGQTGSNVKFTDVRTMVLTMVDTGTLSAVNELSNQNIPKTLSTLLDSCGDGFSGSRSLENRSIADQYSKYFDLPIGYSCGQIIPHTMDATMLYNSKMIVASPMLSRYTSYQQMGIPYLLCSDSHKISEFMDCQFRKQQALLVAGRSASGEQDEKLLASFAASMFYKKGGHLFDGSIPKNNRFKWHEVVAIGARNIQLYKSYHNGFGYVLDQLNASMSEKQLKENLRWVAKESRHLWKASFSSVTIFTFHGNRDILKLRESRYQESFKNLGWHQCNIMILKDLPSESRFLDLECLIIDADLKLTLPSTTLSCDALDLAHYLRGKGYLGVIVFAHRNAIFPSNSDNHPQTIAPNDSLRITGSSDSLSSSTRFLTRNPYNHGISIDHHVSMPFSAEDAKVITRLCEERRIRLLLNLRE